MTKIYTLYYDRYETATTSAALSEHEHTVLCHSDADKFKNIHGEIIETGCPKGIQHQFNWALNKANIGDWLIFLSDDYKKTLELQSGKFVEVGIDVAINTLKEEISNVGQSGIALIGLGLTANAFYARKRYSNRGLVDGRMFAIKKTDFLFDEEISTIPDYEMTAWHLRNIGLNLVVNEVVAEFDRYKEGGLGSVSERLEDKINDCARLVEKYKGIINYAHKKGQPKGSHVKIQWRKKL